VTGRVKNLVHIGAMLVLAVLLVLLSVQSAGAAPPFSTLISDYDTQNKSFDISQNQGLQIPEPLIKVQSSPDGDLLHFKLNVTCDQIKIAYRDLSQSDKARAYAQFLLDHFGHRDKVAANLDADGEGKACKETEPPDTTTPPTTLPTPAPTTTPTPAPTPEPPFADLDCEDFETQEAAQIVYNQDPVNDPHKLDSDNDGIPCGNLPSAEEPNGGEEGTEDTSDDPPVAVADVSDSGDGPGELPFTGPGMTMTLLVGGSILFLVGVATVLVSTGRVRPAGIFRQR
jgi:Excalibur calcium-binding domain